MPDMQVPSTFSLFCAGILLASPLSAIGDTLTLKSGETYDGKILSESDKEILMDVTVASGITDQKSFPKSDVQEVSKTPLDEIAFQTIKDCQLESHSLPSASYAAIVKSLEAFLKQYPLSPHIEEVRTTLDAFKKEQARVKAGDLKWANHWYTPKEAEKNKYQLAAQMCLQNMRSQAARRDFIGALNSFTQIEKNYPGSTAFPDSIELAQYMMRIASIDMERFQTAAKVQESQFNSGIVLVPEPQKSQMIAARQAQIASAEAALAAADHAGVVWKPVLPMAAKSFETLKTTLSTEGPRIDKLPVADMRQSIAAANEAEAELNSKNAERAEEKIKEAQKSWPQNERIPSLNLQLTALKESLKPKPTPTPSPTPSPTPAPLASATPSPSPVAEPPPKKRSKH